LFGYCVGCVCWDYEDEVLLCDACGFEMSWVMVDVLQFIDEDDFMFVNVIFINGVWLYVDYVYLEYSLLEVMLLWDVVWWDKVGECIMVVVVSSSSF